MRSVLICLLLAGSTAVSATPRHLILVNDGPRRISAVHSAVPGSNEWRSVLIAGGGLSGGGDAETLKMETGPGCLSDLRIAFAGNHQLIVRAFNVCRYRGLRAGTAWRLGHAQQRAQAIIATKDESGSHP